MNALAPVNDKLAALARADGVGLTFTATLNVIPIHNTLNGELHHAMRLDRLPTPSGNWSPANAARQRV